MEKINHFFVEYSLGFGVIGLGISLNELGVSSIASMGFIVAFTSIWSVLMEILRTVAAEKN
jgi:VanZ family protein